MQSMRSRQKVLPGEPVVVMQSPFEQRSFRLDGFCHARKEKIFSTGKMALILHALLRRRHQNPSLSLSAVWRMYFESYRFYLLATLSQADAQWAVWRYRCRRHLRSPSRTQMYLVSHLLSRTRAGSNRAALSRRKNTQLEYGKNVILVECIDETDRTADNFFTQKKSS